MALALAAPLALGAVAAAIAGELPAAIGLGLALAGIVPSLHH